MGKSDLSDAQREVHGAIQDHYLDEEEVLVRWVLVAEVADAKGKHLVHRSGGGADGLEPGTAWEALGMLRTASALAEEQAKEWSEDA